MQNLAYKGPWGTEMPSKNMRHDLRIKQANREALITLAVYGLYFVWWYVFGYGLGNEDPETYSYVFSFPAWFFYSCILGYPVITILLWIIVRLFFRDVPLDVDGEDEAGGGGGR